MSRFFKSSTTEDAAIAKEKASLPDTEAPAATENNGATLAVLDEAGHSKDVQAGVQKMEAATSVWTKAHLIAAYGM